MNKALIVAQREFKAAVMTKAFIISIVMMPLLMGGSILVQALVKDTKSLKEKVFVIIDRTPNAQLTTPIKMIMDHRNKVLIYEKKDKTKDDSVKDTKTSPLALQEELKPEDRLQKLPVFTMRYDKPSDNTPEAILKQRFELAEQIRTKEIFGFVDIGMDVLDAPELTQQFYEAYAATMAASIAEFGREMEKNKARGLPDNKVIRYYSNSPTYNDFLVLVREVLNRSIQGYRSGEFKYNPTSVARIIQSVPVSSLDLPRRNPITGEIEDGKDVNPLVTFLVPFGIVIIMFMVIMVGATPLMQGVVEEKMQRISEVLLSSAQPFQLMMGKIIGGASVSLLLGVVYIAGAYIAASRFGFGAYLTPQVMMWFLIYLVLAVVMFGSLFVAVGAACTDIKETQSLLMPVMLLATFPMFFLSNVIMEPDGKVATIMSFIPFATPALMTARVAIPPGAPWWHPVVGIVGVLATTLLCVWIASRIFRVGLLMQGKGATFGEVVKWVIKG